MSVITEMDELFVRPVAEHDDVVAFQFPFELEGKAAEDRTVTELDNGDLLIEGWAADFDGEDRMGENFVDGAFKRGIKAFLGRGTSPLCFHHKRDVAIGRILELEEVEGKGLFMRARVDAQPESSPHRWIYNGIKKGSISGLSVGGFFKRAYINGKQKIADMDFTEISVTPVPCHARTSFSVVGGKALDSLENEPAESVEDFSVFSEWIDGLNKVFDSIEESKALVADPPSN